MGIENKSDKNIVLMYFKYIRKIQSHNHIVMFELSLERYVGVCLSERREMVLIERVAGAKASRDEMSGHPFFVSLESYTVLKVIKF